MSPGLGNKNADVRVCVSSPCTVAGGPGAFPHHMPSFPPAVQQLRLNGIVTERLAVVLTCPYANVNKYRTASVPSTPGLDDTLNFIPSPLI